MIVGFVLFIGLMATMFIIYNPPSDKEIASYQARLKKELEEKGKGVQRTNIHLHYWPPDSSFEI